MLNLIIVRAGILFLLFISKKRQVFCWKCYFFDFFSVLFIALKSLKLVIVFQMDPVQKAVINHTFGVSIPPKKKQVISCNVCQLRFNSDVSIACYSAFFFFFGT